MKLEKIPIIFIYNMVFNSYNNIKITGNFMDSLIFIKKKVKKWKKMEKKLEFL